MGNRFVIKILHIGKGLDLIIHANLGVKRVGSFGDSGVELNLSLTCV